MTNGDFLDWAVLAELEKHIGRDRLKRVVAIQIEHGRAMLAQIEPMIAAPHPQLLRRLVHQMAGSTASLGMTRLSAAAIDLEIGIASGDLEVGQLSMQLHEFWILGVKSHDALEHAYSA